VRKFDPETAVAAMELEQIVADYWQEIDDNGGCGAADFFTEDCVVQLGSSSFKGHAGVTKYYADRLEKIRVTQKDGVRTTRHSFSNLRMSFENNNRATLRFLIIGYAAAGSAPVANATVPAGVSDMRFECRRDPEGHWMICEFYGSAVFVGGV